MGGLGRRCGYGRAGAPRGNLAAAFRTSDSSSSSQHNPWQHFLPSPSQQPESLASPRVRAQLCAAETGHLCSVMFLGCHIPPWKGFWMLPAAGRFLGFFAAACQSCSELCALHRLRHGVQTQRMRKLERLSSKRVGLEERRGCGSGGDRCQPWGEAE